MTHTIQIDLAALASIASQVGQKLEEGGPQLGGSRFAARAPGAGSAPAHVITETFPVWVADDQISAAPGAAPTLLLSASAHATGMLHHNIVSVPTAAPGAAPSSPGVVAAARSRRSSSGAYKVEAILHPTAGNELLRWIRNAAYWVQHNAQGNPLYACW